MKIRRPLTITSRTSSITNSFVQAIVPRFKPSQEELTKALSFFGMTLESTACVYCGAKTTDLDHLRPLVQNKRPTGYVHEIGNLVPACGPCNQSKGGQDWRQWMQGNARGSPTTKGVNNIAERINQLERFENWAKLRKEDLQSPAQKEEWEKHWENLEVILKKMAEAQIHAEKLREAMQAALQSSRDCQGRAE